MVARVVPQSARRRHAESRKPDLWGWAARPKAPVLRSKTTGTCALNARTRISFAATGAAIPTTATTFVHRQCGTEATSGITANSASSKHLLHVEFAKQNTLSMSA